MKDTVSAVAVGLVNGEPAVDLSKEEEDLDGAVDVPIAVQARSGKVTLIQLDGEIKKDDLIKAIKLGVKASAQLVEIQRKALRAKFEGE